MSDDFYHDALLALAKDNAASGRLDPCDGTARVDNPLCGDRVTIDVRISNGKITEIAQKTRGCILTRAAAAMIARNSRGVDITETAALLDAARRYLDGDEGAAGWPEWTNFRPVQNIKSRHDCVLIAFRALERAAHNRE